MINPYNYLLNAIVKEENNYPTLPSLDGKHVKDISNLMEKFTLETVDEIFLKLEKGEAIPANGKLYKLKK